ncbi:MAG TPA: hypothetical protein VKR06_32880 [Ktedonosporobacter sp.]|nr:hypothetical protein [Ktedonosporobacter sp.]
MIVSRNKHQSETPQSWFRLFPVTTRTASEVLLDKTLIKAMSAG